MATASFDKAFVINDPEAAAELRRAMTECHSPRVEIAKKDIKSESIRGVKSLARKLQLSR